jgi:hypothetical protein
VFWILYDLLDLLAGMALASNLLEISIGLHLERDLFSSLGKRIHAHTSQNAQFMLLVTFRRYLF